MNGERGRRLLIRLVALVPWLLVAASAFGQGVESDLSGGPPALLQVQWNETENSGALAPALRVGLLLLGLTLLPAIVVSVTSFTRIVIVLGFLRMGLGTNSLPPTPVILGLSLFLTLFTMGPELRAIHEEAVVPLEAGEIGDLEALQAALVPLRAFMARHTREEDLRLFLQMADANRPASFAEVPTLTLVPAFLLSELRTAFIMGALLLIPFVIVDLVVGSVLMSMGMMMVPPVMISLPFKVLLFVVADGWNLVVASLARSIMAGG
jgi:flagellar biosynthetic protein FliP